MNWKKGALVLANEMGIFILILFGSFNIKNVWANFGVVDTTGPCTGGSAEIFEDSCTVTSQRVVPWYFNQDASCSGSGCTNNQVTVNTSTNAAADGSLEDSPTSYTLEVHGTASTNGTEPGGPVAWSVTGSNTSYLIKSSVAGTQRTITVPVGQSLTLYAEKDGAAESSNWAVGGYDSSSASAQISIDTNYTFNIENPAIDTLREGSYPVNATSNNDSSLTDNVKLEIVRAEITANDQLAFDDYTNYGNKSIYYTNKSNERSATVYAVVDDTKKKLNINLTPSPMEEKVDWSMSSSSGSMSSSCAFNFNSAGNFTVKCKNETLVTAEINKYEAITRSYRIVRVKNTGGTEPNLPPLTGINYVFGQCNISFSGYSATYEYTYPTGNTWDLTSLNTLVTTYIAQHPATNRKHVIFVLNGTWGPVPTNPGLGNPEFNNNIGYCFIFIDQVSSGHDWKSLVPHEMCHNYGADDTYKVAPKDQNSVMYNSPDQTSENYRLRQPVWTTIRAQN